MIIYCGILHNNHMPNNNNNNDYIHNNVQGIKPSNVLIHEDGRAVLSDFEFSRESRSLPGEEDISASSSMRAGTRGYMAPEVESGEGAVFASDMYSFGVLLMFMHYPALASNIIPGSLRLPSSCELELADLIQHLTAVRHLFFHYHSFTFL